LQTHQRIANIILLVVFTYFSEKNCALKEISMQNSRQFECLHFRKIKVCTLQIGRCRNMFHTAPPAAHPADPFIDPSPSR